MCNMRREIAKHPVRCVTNQEKVVEEVDTSRVVKDEGGILEAEAEAVAEVHDAEEVDPVREVADEARPDRDHAAHDDPCPQRNLHLRVPATPAPSLDLNLDLRVTSPDLHRSRDLDPVRSLLVTPDRSRSRNPREGQGRGRRIEDRVKETVWRNLWKTVETYG